MTENENIQESAINIVSEGTRLEGRLVFEHVSRVHGTLVGEVSAKPGSTLIIGETSVVEGNIDADTLIVDGFIRGDVLGKTRVVVSRTGRIVGNIRTPSLKLEFGAHFEGQCSMEDQVARIDRPLKPA